MLTCLDPLPGWRIGRGVFLQPGQGSQTPGVYLELPCGTCTECRKQQARLWTLRCRLELQLHQSAAWGTFTYDEQHCPVTLTKRHFQLFLKRLRKAAFNKSSGRTLRYFYSGEYGEQTQRPHYHAILYGAHCDTDRQVLESSWGLGHAHIRPVTPERIAYTAGYTAKKTGDKLQASHERVDPDTGEVYTWQPPFTDMSRGDRRAPADSPFRYGIGSNGRQWPTMWRDYAVMDGYKMAVPRYYKQAYLDNASEEELERYYNEQLERLKATQKIKTKTATSQEERIKEIQRTIEDNEYQKTASIKISEAKQRQRAETRKL